MTHIVPSQAGITMLFVSPIEEPDAVDFTVLSDWCTAMPVIAWNVDGESVTPVTIGATGNRMAVACDLFLFSNGTVYDLNKELMYVTLSEWVEMQFEVEMGALSLAKAAESVSAALKAAPPNKSPNLRDLGVSGRACAPLERMGIVTLAQLAVQSRADIKGIKGVAASTVKDMDKMLADNDLHWDYDPKKVKADPTEAPAETPDDDEEDVL